MKTIIFSKALTAGTFLLAALAAGAAPPGATPNANGKDAKAAAPAGAAQGAKANDARAALQDKKDIINNAEAVGEGALAQDAAGTPQKAGKAANPPAKGGKGGTDPATGEKLFPLPSESEFCKKSGQDVMDGTQNKKGDCSSAVQGQIPTVDNMVSVRRAPPSSRP
jgi:hypothetical protein